MALRVLIVDDEQLSRETLRSLLVEYCEDIEVVADAGSAEEARECIAREQPDVLFLDIEMPNEDGFDLLRSLPEHNFAVVFVTAYDHYAINAIKASASDYLLKPVDIDELRRAVQKVRDAGLGASDDRDEVYREQLQTVLENLGHGSRKLKRISLPCANGFRLVNVANVIRLEADNNYSTFHLSSGEKILVTRSIKEYTDLLENSDFVRVHKSHLVNLEHVERFIRESGTYVVMSDDTTIEVSRRKKDELLRKIQDLGV